MTFRSIPLFCNFLCENYTKVPRIIFSHGQFMRELDKYIRENPNITEGLGMPPGSPLHLPNLPTSTCTGT